MENHVSKSLGCYVAEVANPNKIWRGETVLGFYLPNLAAQIALILFTTRSLHYILRPLNQPLIVAEIIASFLMSRAIFGSEKIFTDLYRMKSVLNVETVSHIGIIYYVFLIGLDMNMDTILKAKKKATSIAMSGTFFAMALNGFIYSLLQKWHTKDSNYFSAYDTSRAYLFWSLIFSVTSFPILAQILADLKLLYTGLGKVALTAAMINDLGNWLMWALLAPFAIHNLDIAIYSLLSNIAFVLFIFFVLRPYLGRIIIHKTNQNEWDNNQLFFVIMGAFVCAAITDILGTHPIAGALMYGMIIPRGKFTAMLTKKSEDFAVGFLLPLFFYGCSIRLNIVSVVHAYGWLHIMAIVLLSCIPKILSTIIITFFFGMTTLDGVALGLLMNTKGILPIIMLNIASDKEILSREAYTIALMSILVMTLMVPLIINLIYKPMKRFEQNKLRTIQNLKVDAELKVLACVHNTRHAKGMMNLLEASNDIKVSPLHVFALQLIELTRATTALFDAGDEKSNHQQADSQEDIENIANVFKSYAEGKNNTEVETSVAVSAYSTIHEDIYNLAQEKQTTFILLPFHKHSSIEGILELTKSAYKDINQNVMLDAPCSVGIFVDRGLGSLLKVKLKVLMLFIGGPDDREALAVAWRMSKNQGVQLSVVRILLLEEGAEVEASSFAENHGLLSAVVDNEKQKEFDDEYVSSFRLKAVNIKDSISYSEKEVQSGDDIKVVISELDKLGFDLYIIGQGTGRNSLVLSNLLKWTDCPELGVIGDLVASNIFGSSSSLLVVQQYGFGGMTFGTAAQHPSENIEDNDGSEALFVKVE
ncbi:hypothetical protein TanjilG_16179 [Lupinus angustifolius]|uniref:Uncharacterized protein n=1 Tax=Lupinus angustifolius TaxID=3871 RepID=A0A1J7HAD9_LUPAN|nr:PREDICTED: cation/H(+) antiporter 15-like [Lupinus angustifolius]OIV97418.1 hypothetical protein TanjilG_16179 [Lupinus angustifolius]